MVDTILQEQAYALLAERKIQNCITLFEDSLRQISVTPYHVVLGRNLLALTDSAALYLQDFYAFAASQIDVKAIYLEMNELAINPDLWFMDAFGYKNYQGLGDLDWLCDWDTPKFDSFILTGFEDIQKVYEEVYLDQSQPEEVQKAGAMAEYLITLRLQELCGAAHHKAVEAIREFKEVVVLSTSHDFDFIYKSVLD